MHAYTLDGKPQHEVENKSGGGTRPTTIRDMKKLELLPSVTGVLDIFENPAINIWKQNQITKAAYEYLDLSVNAHDKRLLVSYDDYHSYVISEAFKPSRDALDVGSSIHDAIEAYFNHGSYNDIDVTVDAGTFKISEFVEPTLELLRSEGIEVTDSEITLVNVKEGYAGRCDCAFKSTDFTKQGIGDFKTCGNLPTKPYQFHPTQIAAYYKAKYGDFPKKKDGACGFNLYIGKNRPGEVKIFWYDWEELKSEWRLFESALHIWRYLRNYDPRKTA